MRHASFPILFSYGLYNDAQYVMTYIVMANIVMANIVMACNHCEDQCNIFTACIDMAYIDMACIVMANIDMPNIVNGQYKYGMQSL